MAQRAGIGYVPEDRRAEGFVARLGVAENATMTITSQLSDRFGVLRPGRRAAAAAPLTSRLSLVSSGPGQPAGELSVRGTAPSVEAASSRRRSIASIASRIGRTSSGNPITPQASAAPLSCPPRL